MVVLQCNEIRIFLENSSTCYFFKDIIGLPSLVPCVLKRTVFKDAVIVDFFYLVYGCTRKSNYKRFLIIRFEFSYFISFPPDYIKGYDAETWLYEATAKLWSNWLPEDTMADIRRCDFVHGQFYFSYINQTIEFHWMNESYAYSTV